MEPWIRAPIVPPNYVIDCSDSDVENHLSSKERIAYGSVRSHFWVTKSTTSILDLVKYLEDMKSSCFHYLQRYMADKESRELLLRLAIPFSGTDPQSSFQSTVQSDFTSVSFSVGNYGPKFSALAYTLVAELQEWITLFSASSQVTILGISMDCKTLSSHIMRTQTAPLEDQYFNEIHAFRYGSDISTSTIPQETSRLVNYPRYSIVSKGFCKSYDWMISHRFTLSFWCIFKPHKVTSATESI